MPKRTRTFSPAKIKAEIDEAAKAAGVEKMVSIRSVTTWATKGAPIGDRDMLMQWVARQKQLPPAVLAWLETHKVKRNKPKAKPKAEEATAESIRDEYFLELKQAKDAGDVAREKIALEAYLKIDKQIRESEAHAKKLGLDRGEVLPRADAERIFRNVVYAGNACVEGALKQICERVAAMDKPADVYHFLKPVILGGRLFLGMQKMTQQPGDVNVPDWAARCFFDALDDFIEKKK